MKIIYSIIFFTILIAILSFVVSTAFAQNQFMYSIKFVCIPTVGPDKESVFIPQNYSTVVNVHNPYNHSIDFSKKAVIAQSEDEDRGPISNLRSDFLKPDQALSINCNDILSLFNHSPSTIGDGFVVLKSNVKLDVSAVYTTQSSIDVEYIQPIEPRMLKFLFTNNRNEDYKFSNVPVNLLLNIKINSDNGLSIFPYMPSICGSTTLTFCNSGFWRRNSGFWRQSLTNLSNLSNYR